MNQVNWAPAPGVQIEHPVFGSNLLPHAIRYWEAERENAARQASRGNITLTALSALFGLGLFRIEWMHGSADALNVHSPYFCMWIKGCLIGSLLFFSLAFFQTIRSSRFNLWRFVGAAFQAPEKNYGCASQELRFSAEEIRELPNKSENEVTMLIFARVFKAADELMKRNMLRAKHQHRANLLFSVGLLFVAAAILLYILGSDPAMIK